MTLEKTNCCSKHYTASLHQKHSELTPSIKNTDRYYLIFFTDLIAGSETMIFRQVRSNKGCM